MYVASTRGILVYKNVDSPANDGFIPYTELPLDPSKTQQMQVMKGALDCNQEGRIIFDLKNKDGKQFLKAYGGGVEDTGVQDVTDQELKGDKSFLKLYKTHVVEVKIKTNEENELRTESTLSIYDFDNKILMVKKQFQG